MWRQVVSRGRVEVRAQEDNRDARENFEYMLNFGRSLSGREPHCVFLNTGADPRSEGRFACVSASSGLDLIDDGRAIAVADWDHDGDQDLWITNRTAPRVRFMRNDTPTADARYLQLRLVGNGTTTNRDAVGARVEVVPTTVASTVREAASAAERRKSIRTVRAGHGFLAQSSRWLHYGLGDIDDTVKVIVRWPDAAVEEFVELELDRKYELVQGTGRAGEVPAIRPPARLAKSTPSPHEVEGRARIPLIALVPLPNLSYTDRTGSPRSTRANRGKSLLINCWSTTCRPCIAELKEFSERADAIRDAGIEVLALSLDNLGPGGAVGDGDYELLDSLGFPFAAGRANDDLMKILSLLHNSMIATARPLSVPTSFLIDETGRLSVIYKGPVAVDQLIEDVAHASRTSAERFRAAAYFDGTDIDHPVTRSTLLVAELKAHMDCARGLQRLRWTADAIVVTEDLVNRHKAFAPARKYLVRLLLREQRNEEALAYLQEALAGPADDGEMQQLLGEVYRRLRRFEEAVAAYERATELLSDPADAHGKLGSLLADLGRWPQARQSLAKSVELNPDDAGVHFKLAQVGEQLGDDALAERHYLEAIRVDPKLTEVQERFGKFLAKLERWSQAVKQFEIVLARRPKNAGAHYNLGVAHAKIGQWQQAAEHLQAALAIQPDFAQARAYLERVQAVLRGDGDATP
ncbi:MAG: tetratricopeptide repeat protein [Planctomycetota bacterium]|nr:MAG: tetratricopeptide repeat protein [Planctomycetota bacterium]REK38186.1 MAG: tetratricopeptide repeat protein [Planctomycetota bacterium]